MNTFWKDKSVLVTGAGGFIGSNLTKYLVNQNASVTVLLRSNNYRSPLFIHSLEKCVNIINGDIRNIDDVCYAVSRFDSEYVFHLAAQPVVTKALNDPLVTLEDNIRGTYNVLEACRKYIDQIKSATIASSDKAYGDVQAPPFVETMNVSGRHPYDVSKACGDMICQAYAHSYGLPISIARCGNVYGEGDLHWTRIIPGAIKAYLKNERPLIRSNGTLTRDYVFVSDIVRAYAMLGQHTAETESRGDAFNFATGVPTSVNTVLELLQSLCNSDLEPIYLDQAKSEISHQSLVSAKAAAVLGWKAKVPMDEGLSQTVQWYSKYFESQTSERYSC